MSAPPSIPVPRKILVIDDNAIIQRTLQMALQERGYKVILADAIPDALTKIRNEKPHLILLDLSFPPDSGSVGLGMRDGFWALEWMHHLTEVKDIPIIIISSSEPDEFKPRALAAGAAAYFQKPINADELAATIAGLLAGKAPG